MWRVCYNIGSKWKCDCIDLPYSSLWDFGSPGCWGLVSSSEWGANGCWVDAKGVVTPSIAPHPFPPVHLDPLTWASLCSGFWLSLVNGSYWQKIREREKQISSSPSFLQHRRLSPSMPLVPARQLLCPAFIFDWTLKITFFLWPPRPRGSSSFLPPPPLVGSLNSSHTSVTGPFIKTS